MSTSNLNSLFDHLRKMETNKTARVEIIRTALTKSQIPIAEEIYEAILCLFVTEAKDVLRAHPGFDLEEKIRSIRTTMELFSQASSDLMSALDQFDQFSRSPEFNYRAYKDELAIFEKRIRKEIFAFSELAHSLQDHCRRLRKSWEPSGMAQQIDRCFGDDGLHDFICGLRRCLHHLTMLEATWLIRDLEGNATTHYIFTRLELETANQDWSVTAHQYLNSLPEKIDVRVMALSYVPRVREFYSWLLAECKNAPPSEVKDYRRCWSGHQQRSARQAWRLFLQEFLKREIDAYSYLNQYLTPDEMAEAVRFPKRTREQVDYIIATIDEHSACDDELRSLVYRLFKVPHDRDRKA